MVSKGWLETVRQAHSNAKVDQNNIPDTQLGDPRKDAGYEAFIIPTLVRADDDFFLCILAVCSLR